MDFRTIVQIAPSPYKINYNTGSLFMGSCFADNIGIKLKSYKFPVEHNPFGVLYNPVSVKNNLEILLEEKYMTQNELYYFNNKWLSFSHYTAFSDSDPQKCLERINTSIRSSSQFLKKAKFLFITFGTAWVYEFLESGKVVANCHKIPSQKFRHFLLKVDEIVDLYSELIKNISDKNSELEIIFTVSPIRHWKDGANNNQVSKSTLLLAIHQLVGKFKNVSCFPSYEIFMDELRDYRFYADDMLHPSQFAIDYIWSRFSDTYISEEAHPLMKDIEKILLAINHRPFNPDSEEYKKFLNHHLNLLHRLEEKYPNLDFTLEKEILSKEGC